jgi:Domain of unknown function (DUF4203)
MVPQVYQLPAAVLLLIGGFIAWCAGYRLFRVVLTIYGFILGALIGSSMVGGTATMPMILAAVGGGAVGALIMFLGYFVGVALVGAGVGALIVHLAWTHFDGDPHPFVIVLAAVGGAAAAMMLQRYVIIVATAFAGAWTLIVGGLALTPLGRAFVGEGKSVWVVYPLDPLPGRRWVLAAWVVLGAIGMVIQSRFTSRRKARKS